MYNAIPSYNFLLYLREAEFRIKNKLLSDDQKIKEFFECFTCIKNTKDVIIENNNTFLKNSDFKKSDMVMYDDE